MANKKVKNFFFIKSPKFHKYFIDIFSIAHLFEICIKISKFFTIFHRMANNFRFDEEVKIKTRLKSLVLFRAN